MSDSNLTRTEATTVRLEDVVEAATQGVMKALEARGTTAAGEINEINKFQFPYVTIGIIWRPPTGEGQTNQGTNEPS